MAEETKNEAIKRRYGVSGSRYRAMRRAGLDIVNFSDAVAAYKHLMKERRLQRKKIRKAKRDAARGGRNNSDKPKTKKKK